jgi:predicted unusual protein kinase regulating ubiquinone biosynthesis (AarF/ABC1/UbiB family)/nucleotide-binding universal stress UspA family protein
MESQTKASPTVRRVLVATDRSETADHAVRWAATLAEAYGAELVVLQVLIGPAGANGKVSDATAALERLAQDLAGPRGRARVVSADDPAEAILKAAQAEQVDVIVVGNVGMSGRKQFLLGNIPNRVSHNARCSVVIVNTRPLNPNGQPDVVYARPPIDQDAGPTEGEVIGRALRIGRVLARVGLGAWQERSATRDEAGTRRAARRLRDALDQLGPTFAKLGQILSTRPDLLPPIVIEELATLQERVTPLTEAEVVGAMEQELGVPWEDVFASIDPKPLAAGTIAQVHRATLESGERVVVKVQRPTAERDILEDLALLDLLAKKAAGRPAFRRAIDLPAMIEHLSSSLRRELDFRNEARNLRKMAEVLAPFSRLAVPAVYEELSTARLLVMGEVQGSSIHEAPPGPARQEAARQLLEAYYHQVMVAGFFHADPHPGNMKWWNDKIYFLDLGMVGEIDAATRELVVLMMLAFAQGDGSFLAEVAMALAGASVTPDLNVAAFRSDLQGLIDQFRQKTLREIQLGPLIQEVTRISARHHVRVPAALTLMGKAFAQMQLVAAELDPTLDPFAVAQSFVLRSTLRHLSGQLDPQRIFYNVQKARLRLTRLAEGLESALGARPGTGLQVQMGGVERLERVIGQASRQISLAAGLCGALALAGFTAGRGSAPRWVPMLMGGIGAVLAAELVRRRE